MDSGVADISEVARFGTLFQLWAGICVLCFYDKFLDKLVAGESRENTMRLLNDFKQRLHGLMTDEQHANLSKLIDSSLNNYKNCIIHLGKLSFFICICILFSSAFDGYKFASLPIYTVVTGFVIYVGYIMFYKDVEWSFKMWTFLIPAFIFLILFCIPLHVDKSVEIGFVVSEQSIGAVLFLMLMSVPLFGLIRYYWEKSVFGVLSKSVNKIESDFQSYSVWKALPTENNFNKIRNKFITDILLSDIPVRELQTKVDEYFYKSIRRAFCLLRFKSYIAFYCRAKREYIVVNTSSIIVIFIAITFVLFYIFMEIMCYIYL